jgi:hypothetical protein
MGRGECAQQRGCGENVWPLGSLSPDLIQVAGASGPRPLFGRPAQRNLAGGGTPPPTVWSETLQPLPQTRRPIAISLPLTAWWSIFTLVTLRGCFTADFASVWRPRSVAPLPRNYPAKIIDLLSRLGAYYPNFHFSRSIWPHFPPLLPQETPSSPCPPHHLAKSS